MGIDYRHAYEVQYKLYHGQCGRSWTLFQENKELREIVARQGAALEAAGGDMPTLDYVQLYNDKCNEIAALRMEFNDKRDELVTQETHVDDLKRQLDDANRRLNGKCTEIGNMRSEFGRVKEHRQGLLKEAGERSKEIRSLRATLSDRTLERDDAVKKTEELDAMLKARRGKEEGASNWEQLYCNTRAANVRLSGEVHDMVKANKQAREQVHTLTAGHQRLENRLAEAQEENRAVRSTLAERNRVSEEYLTQVHRLCAELKETQARPPSIFASPVPTSGEILRLFTEACMDPTSEVRGPLEDAYGMALRREQTAAKVEDYMGKEGAEKLAEQVAQLVKGKLAEKGDAGPGAIQRFWPHFELDYLEEPAKIPTAQLKPGNIYLDAHWQVCIYVPNCTAFDCYWYNSEGYVQAANQAPSVVTHIGQLKAVYPIKESK